MPTWEEIMDETVSMLDTFPRRAPLIDPVMEKVFRFEFLQEIWMVRNNTTRYVPEIMELMQSLINHYGTRQLNLWVFYAQTEILAWQVAAQFNGFPYNVLRPFTVREIRKVLAGEDAKFGETKYFDSADYIQMLKNSVDVYDPRLWSYIRLGFFNGEMIALAVKDDIDGELIQSLGQ